MVKTMKKGFTLIELMIVVAIIGILAAIAIPNFIKFQARSKQAEAKANMKAAYTAEKAYYQEKDSYSASVQAIGFSPERGNRYHYKLSDTCGSSEVRSAANITGLDTTTACIQVDTFKYQGTTADPNNAAITAAVATGSTGNFLLEAAGNVDNDATTDDWSISSASRASAATSGAAYNSTCASGNNPAGEPCNDINDV